MLPSNLSSHADDAGLAEFFQLSSELMCLIDKQNNFSLINPAFERVLSYPAASIQEKSFLDFVHHEELDLVRESLAAAFEKQEASTFACRFLGKDKSEKWLLWRVYPKANGTAYAVAKDITPFR